MIRPSSVQNALVQAGVEPPPSKPPAPQKGWFARLFALLARIVFFWREEPRCGNCRYFDRAGFEGSLPSVFRQLVANVSPDELLNQKRDRRDPETMAVLKDTPDDVAKSLKGRVHTWDCYGACGMQNKGVSEGYLCGMYKRGRSRTR